MAGIKLLAEIRSRDPFIPLILQSSEVDNKVYAGRYDASFVDKNSKKMNIDLREIISEHFGFGDFIFRNPDTFEEVREALEKAGIPMASADVTMIPQNYVKVTDETALKGLQRTLDLLDEDDDVQAVYRNWDEE